MSAQLLARRGLCPTERRGAKGLSYGSGSRHAIVTFAKRGGGVSKELRELQQLKEGAATAAPPPSPAPAASSPPPAPTTTTTTPSPAPVAPASPPTTPAPATPTASTTSTTGGGGLADNLLVRILLSATAIMAVIGVFYSIVFYAGSNFVYVFKDQLASITKKDFVPYSERRRMEQEVLAKLEAENEARVAQRAAAAAAAAASAEAGASEAAAEGGAEDNAELLNLLPGAGKR